MRCAALTLLLSALAGSPWAGEEPVLPAGAEPSSVLLGRSAGGRAIRAVRVGSPRARVKLLVIGSVHGNEPAGREIAARLLRSRPPRGTALWLIQDLNPDGHAAGTRQNARGVDLNRNFPYRWQPAGGPFDTYHSGVAALSEPESSALAGFVERLRPRVTLWYHQALRIVVRSDGDAALERLYSRRAGLPRRSLPPYHGTAVSWQNHRFPGDTAFVVELPAGRPTPSDVTRHARAALSLAGAVAPQPVVARPIPFGGKRRRDMSRSAMTRYRRLLGRLPAPASMR